MNKETLVKFKRYQTYLNLKRYFIDLSGLKTDNLIQESVLTIFANAFFSQGDYPESAELKDILKYLEEYENKELEEFVKNCSICDYPIKQEDMEYATQKIDWYATMIFSKDDEKEYLNFLDVDKFSNVIDNDYEFHLNGPWADFFIGAEYDLIMKIKKIIEKTNFFCYEKPMVVDALKNTGSLSMRPDLSSDMEMYIQSNRSYEINEELFKNNVHVIKRKIQNKRLELITEDEKTFFDKFEDRRVREKKYFYSAKNGKDRFLEHQRRVRESLYSFFNIRFEIKDDGTIQLLEYNYIADEEFYKNRITKFLKKISYRPKYYTREININLNTSQFDIFVKNYKEYIKYDNDKIKELLN